MNGYYLIAFNSKIRHIELKQEKIQSKVKDTTSLEYIDSVTQQFDKNRLKQGLVDQGITESYDTPIYVVKLSKSSYTDKADLEFYRILTQEDSETFDKSYKLFNIFKEYHSLYHSNREFKQLADYFIPSSVTSYLSIQYGRLDRAYVPNYWYARKMEEVLGIYKKYPTLDSYLESGFDYHKSKEEIIDLLSAKFRL